MMSCEGEAVKEKRVKLCDFVPPLCLRHFPPRDTPVLPFFGVMCAADSGEASCRLVVGSLSDGALHSRSFARPLWPHCRPAPARAEFAVLTTDELHVLRLPRALLPADASTGCVLELTLRRNIAAEAERDQGIRQIQERLVHRLHGESAAAACQSASSEQRAAG